MDALTTRNFKALSDGLKQMRSEVSELHKKLARQDTVIAQLRQELEEAKNAIIVLKVQHYNGGPTVKG